MLKLREVKNRINQSYGSSTRISMIQGIRKGSRNYPPLMSITTSQIQPLCLRLSRWVSIDISIVKTNHLSVFYYKIPESALFLLTNFIVFRTVTHFKFTFTYKYLKTTVDNCFNISESKRLTNYQYQVS